MTYVVDTQWNDGFQARMQITNTGSTPIERWNLQWSFANGQTIRDLWNGHATQTGRKVVVANAESNGRINPGASVQWVGFNASRAGNTNARPTNFTLNATRCSVG